MRRITIVFITPFLIMACASHSTIPMTAEEVVASAKSGVTFVQNKYLEKRLADNPDLLLFDVRTEAEFKAGHITGAKWVPRGKIEFNVAQNVRDADAEIVIYCRTGSRAALVKKALDAQGYTNVTAHQGYEFWAERGESTEVE